MSPESAAQRVRRLLTMVPWLMRRQGIPVAEAASALGVTEAQVRKDLGLLFMCGLPGHGPGDLIEVSLEHDTVQISNADEIARPLRLTTDEAVALIVGLRTLASVPDLPEREVLDRTLHKLTAATGRSADVAERVQVETDDSVDTHILHTVRQAWDQRRRLRLSYHVVSRDEVTERDVDPMNLINEFSRWYLDCWCHKAEGVRTLRVDRILEATLLDEDGTPPEDARPRELTGLRYVPADGDVAVVLELAPEAWWVADYYPCERLSAAGEEPIRVKMMVGETTWVPRLCCQLGGAVTVLEPSDLAREVGQQARAALQAYQ